MFLEIIKSGVSNPRSIFTAWKIEIKKEQLYLTELFSMSLN